MAALAQKLEPQNPVLEVRNLVKRFGSVEVLKDISISMAEGDFLVLVGPSGCGKSTLLNCVAGLDSTSGGQIVIGGRDVTEVPPRDRDIAPGLRSSRCEICSRLLTSRTFSACTGFGTFRTFMPKAMFSATVIVG